MAGHNGKDLITIVHRGPRPLVDSTTFSLIHRLDEGRQRRTSGTITRINDDIVHTKLMWSVVTNELKKTNENTTVFGTTNPKRCPVRSEKTMLTGSESIRNPPIITPSQSKGLAGTIKNMIHITTSATYAHPRASTILTGNGFFIPSPAFVAKRHFQRRPQPHLMPRQWTVRIYRSLLTMDSIA